MDIVYLSTAVAFWAAVVVLAQGCDHLQNRKVTS